MAYPEKKILEGRQEKTQDIIGLKHELVSSTAMLEVTITALHTVRSEKAGLQDQLSDAASNKPQLEMQLNDAASNNAQLGISSSLSTTPAKG